jgi:Histidinol phosphatase and related hydrolases of the PHP family
LNSELEGITLLKGVEVNILPDGSLDYPDDLLEEFDFVVAGTHQNFRKNVTERVLAAMDNPNADVIAHPTGSPLSGIVGHKIDPDLCNKCYTSVQICPAGIFIQKDKDSIPKVLGAVAEDFCISCGHCAAICPKQAIIHESFPEGSINPVCQELNLSAEQVLEMIRTMRSIREFRDKPIEKETIERIIDGARFAPSSTNSQIPNLLW